MDRRYIICLSIAAFLHGTGIFFFQFQKELQERSKRKIYGIEYVEEREKKKEIEKKREERKEEERKLITPKEPTVGLKEKLKDMFEKKEKLEQKISEEDLKKLAQIARPLEVAKPEEIIDVSKMIELHKTQVAINIDQYEKLDIGETGEIEVLRISKSQKTTQEILQEDRIVLPRAATLEKRVGIWTTPGTALPGGEGGKIELERAKASDIRKEQEEFKRAFTESKKPTLLEEIKPAEKPKPKTEVQISGELKDREQLEAPLPHYPDWALRRGISAFLQLQLKVGPDGKMIGMALVISTTGYPDWDNQVINWIRERWKWKELPITTSGYISFRFVIG
ncbi:MAG: energy transducer TonB [bacterium]|nr:energy transducer TonB [bacterium]